MYAQDTKPKPPVVNLAPDRSAFTLLELLVVIAVIAILASILLPALAAAKAKGQATVCFNNHRQLTLAWLLYTVDFEDALPNNFGAAQTKATVAQEEYLNWVNNVMSWELDPENTNTTLIAVGGLGPYCSGHAGIFKCPTDFVVSDLQRSAGWQYRVRSISMNAMVGDAGDFTATGKNVNNPYYRQFFKLTQIPDPTHIFVFIEEHPDSINDGYFLNKPNSGEWQDLPASYHRGAANLSFADGHVEIRRWVNPSTKPPSRPDGAGLPFRVPATEREDFDWLMERTSYKKYYPPKPAKGW